MQLLGIKRLSNIMIVVFFSVFFYQSNASANPQKDFDRARDEFLAGEFSNVIPRLTGLLYPTQKLADEKNLAEAHLLLGIAYYETKQPEPAKAELEESLFIDPSLTLDEALFSEDATRFFQLVKKDRNERETLALEKAALAAENQRYKKIQSASFVLEPKRYYANFIPFGAGQFQNGQKKKGAFFLLAQFVTGGASIAIWSYQVQKYGLSGGVPSNEVSQVQTLQRIQTTSAGLFYALVAMGIIDSLSNFKHQVRRPDLEKIKELDLKIDKKKTILFPIFDNNQAGAAFRMEF